MFRSASQVKGLDQRCHVFGKATEPIFSVLPSQYSTIPCSEDNLTGAPG
jgi:hypothetical protein